MNHNVVLLSHSLANQRLRIYYMPPCTGIKVCIVDKNNSFKIYVLEGTVLVSPLHIKPALELTDWDQQ